MCLPKYCWVCCWNISVDSGAKFFSIFRIMIAVFQILSILEALITARVQHGFELVGSSVRNSDSFRDMMKELGVDNDDDMLGVENHDILNINKPELTEAAKQMIFNIAILLLTSSLLYSLIEIIVGSLAVHGMRKARPNMLLPYIIWTSFLAFIAFAFLALLVVGFVFIMLNIDKIEKEGDFQEFKDNLGAVVIVCFVIFGIFFGLIFGWILWDLLIMSSRHRELKNAYGMDHIMLQEVPNEEKEKMLYPQLT